LSRSTRRARPGPASSTAGGGSRASTKPRGRRRPMTRQLVSRPVEGEAAIDRPASLVHAMARCHSGGSAPGFSQRLCQMFWQDRPARGLASGPTGAGLPSARISGPRELQPYRGRRGSAGAGAGVSVGPVHGGSRPQPAPALLANSRMCGILNLRSAGIWTERRHGHHTRHAPKGLLNPPRRSLDRLSGSSLPAAHVLGPGGPQLKCKQPVGQFPRPVQKSALPNVQRHCAQSNCSLRRCADSSAT
jgi:hypothetical protein